MIIPLTVICVCDNELYTLYENLHYHLNDFVTLIWYMAVTLILTYVLFIEKDFDPHTLRTSHLLSHYGKFIMACHHSKCLLWVPNDYSSYSYVCVWRWTLYALWESTISSEWFCDTNLIRGWDINSVFCFFYRGPLRASNLLERIQLPWLFSELHFGLWHSSIPFYWLNTVDVLLAGLWVAVRTLPGARSSYTIPKDPTSRVWIWNTWQAVT